MTRQLYYGTYSTPRKAMQAGLHLLRYKGLSFRITKYTLGIYHPRTVYKLYVVRK